MTVHPRIAFVRLRPALFVALTCSFVLCAASPTVSPGLRAQDVDLRDGRTLFNTYCASCHGTSGTGSGPLATAMRRQPPDLTGLALANGGVFPAERMRRIIDGREVDAHGNREMPVWGDAFKSIRGGHSEEAVRARIDAILAHLSSIQRRRS